MGRITAGTVSARAISAATIAIPDQIVRPESAHESTPANTSATCAPTTAGTRTAGEAARTAGTTRSSSAVSRAIPIATAICVTGRNAVQDASARAASMSREVPIEAATRAGVPGAPARREERIVKTPTPIAAATRPSTIARPPSLVNSSPTSEFADAADAAIETSTAPNAKSTVVIVAMAPTVMTPASSSGRATVAVFGIAEMIISTSAAAAGTRARYHSGCSRSRANGSTATAAVAKAPTTKLQNGAMR
jgi:hypothetical protein